MNLRSFAVTLLPWMLCLTLGGLPRSGWAATDAPLLAPTGSLSLLAEEAPTETGPAPRKRLARDRAPLGLRLLTEVGVGAITSLSGGLAGVLIGGGGCLALGVGKWAPIYCVISAIVGGVAGLTEGYALGVWWGGELSGGDGSLLITMLGATAGLGLGLAAAYLHAVQTDRPAFELIVPLPMMLGAHLGYELFQRAPVTTLQPTVALSSGGAMLGLSGRF